MSIVPTTNNKQSVEVKGLRRTGFVGIALGVTTILACELPVILALIGLGGLSSAAMAFRPPILVEIVAILLAVVGVGLLIILAVWRLWSRRNKVHP